MKKILTFSALLLAISSTTLSFAAPDGATPDHTASDHEKPRADHFFKTMDQNSDGKVSREEFRTAKQALFTKADSNKDQVVTEAEFKAAKAAHAPQGGQHKEHKAQRGSRMFKHLDKNDDGKITQSELTDADRFFERHDENNDGFVSKDEFKPRHRHHGKQRKAE